MKIKYILLFIVFFRGIVLSKDLSEIVIPLVESLIKNQNIPTLQIIIFSPQKIWLQQFEYDYYDQKPKRNENLYNYFVGELSYPILGYYFTKEFTNIKIKNHPIIQLIEDNLKKSNYFIKKYNVLSDQYFDVYKENSNRLVFQSLLNMTSGLEISKSGIGMRNQDFKLDIKIRSNPFENFYLSTNNYLVLYDSLELFKPEYTISDFFKKVLFYKGSISKEFLKTHNIPYGSFSGKKIKFITDFDIHNVFSYGMITNLKNYMELIYIIYKENLIFDEFYIKTDKTSGYKNGFFYRKTCDGQFYIAENFGYVPGYSSYFFIMENGYGFGIFQSSDDEYTLHFIRDKIEEMLYGVLAIECFKELIDEKKFKSLLGYYRGENILENSVFKNIFTDFWVRVDHRNRFEVSNFFSKDPLGYIEAMNQKLFIRGYSKINRYPLNFIEENHKIKKIFIGIYEYKNIDWYLSIRGIVILFLFVILLIFITILGVIIYAKG